jgi:hypothetical protein
MRLGLMIVMAFVALSLTNAITIIPMPRMTNARPVGPRNRDQHLREVANAVSRRYQPAAANLA